MRGETLGRPVTIIHGGGRARPFVAAVATRLASPAWSSRGTTGGGRSPTPPSGSYARPPSWVTGGTGLAWASGTCAPRGHTSRFLLTVEAYLARPAGAVDVASAADYFRGTR